MIYVLLQEMEKAVDDGLTKSIGVSNFSIKQIRKLNAISRIPPAVHQVHSIIFFSLKLMLFQFLY